MGMFKRAVGLQRSGSRSGLPFSLPSTACEEGNDAMIGRLLTLLWLFVSFGRAGLCRRDPDCAGLCSFACRALIVVLVSGGVTLACSTDGGAGETDTDSAVPSPGDDYGDPDAPGQACPDAFDPDSTYVSLLRADSAAGVVYFADVREPDEECAFALSINEGDLLEWRFAVRPEDGQMLRLIPYDGDVLNLEAVNPDPLERGGALGLWKSWAVGGGHDVRLGADITDGFYCRRSFGPPPHFMRHGATGELGYVCPDDHQLRSLSNDLLVDVTRDIVTTLADGRIVVSAESQPAGLRLVSAFDDSNGVPVMPPDGLELTPLAVQQTAIGVLVLAELHRSGVPLAQLHLEGDDLVLDYEYPQLVGQVSSENAVPAAIDRRGGVTVVLRRATADSTLEDVLVRLDRGFYEELRVTTVQDRTNDVMPESGAVIRSLIPPA